MGSASLLVELGRDCGNALLRVTVRHQTGDPIRFTIGNIRKQIKVKVVIPSRKMISFKDISCLPWVKYGRTRRFDMCERFVIIEMLSHSANGHGRLGQPIG